MLSSILEDYKTFLIFLTIALFLTFFDAFGYLNFPKKLLQNLTIPIQFGLYKTSVNIEKQFEFIFLIRRASQENKALTEQMAQVLSENANLRKKLAQLEAFSEQSNSLGEQTFSSVASRPLGFNRYLLIDKGSDDGIKVDQAVIFKDNYIGQIKEVSPKKSKVMLSQDPDSRISAFASNSEGKAKGVLMGQFGSEMLFDKILHQEPIAKNDLIYTEGIETQIPRGLILGQVSEVQSRDNEVFKQAIVQPVFKIGDLELVFVIVN